MPTPALALGEWCHVCFDEELAVEAVMSQDRELEDQMAEEAAGVQASPEAYGSNCNGFSP